MRIRIGAPLSLAVLALAAVAAAPLGAGAEPGARTLYLVRHGAYDHDDPRDHDVGKGLVPLGMAQARMLAARLRGLPVRIDAVTSSTLTRARETARIVGADFPGLELRETPLLSECTPATRRADIMAREEPADLEACAARLDSAFAAFFTPSPEGERHDVLICHGNVIRWFVTKALGVDTTAWLGMSVGHCSLTQITVRPDGSAKILSVGDVGHIPPNLQSGTTAEDNVLRVPGVPEP